MKRILTKGMCGLLAGGLVLGGAGVSGRIAAAGEKERVTLQTVDEDEVGTQSKGFLDVSGIVEAVMPSVVTITTKSIQEVQDYYGLFGFYGYAPSYEYEVWGSGSGIIIGKNDDELLIATNAHIVEGTSVLSVCFADNEAYKGIVKGYDTVKDVAVVAVSRDDLTKDTLNSISVAEIGSSDALKVGEQVVAIGNAMGYGQSVTTGIVSAKNRQMNDDASGYSNSRPSEDDGVNLIQTDAAINPGNSGGALLNMDGEVVGITNSKLVSNEVESMGYAIAISDVEELITDLMNQKTREKIEGTHGALGIRATSISSEAHRVYRLPIGVFIAEVDEGSAAEKAGIQDGMIITKLDGRSLDSVEGLIDLLQYYEAGEEVVVTVSVPEGNGYKTREFTVTLQESASEDQGSSAKAKSDDSDRSSGKRERSEDRSDRSGGFFDDWFDDDFFADEYDYDEDIDDFDDDFDDDDFDDEESDEEDQDDDEDDVKNDDTDYTFGKGSFGKWE